MHVNRLLVKIKKILQAKLRFTSYACSQDHKQRGISKQETNQNRGNDIS